MIDINMLLGVARWRKTAWTSGLNAADCEFCIRCWSWRQWMDRTDSCSALTGVLLLNSTQVC